MTLDYETRVSFRGRTLAGYANWSLDGRNSIRLNANVVWRDAIAVSDHAAGASAEWRSLTPRVYARAVQAVFALFLGGLARHEVLHLLLHREADARRHAGRYREGEVHEWALGRIDRFFEED